MSLQKQRAIVFLLCLGTLIYTLVPVDDAERPQKPLAFLEEDPTWAQKMLSELSIEQKIDQLIQVSLTPADSQVAQQLFDRYLLGGALLRGFSYEELKRFPIKEYQEKILPPLLGVDQAKTSENYFHLPLHPGLRQLETDSLLISAAGAIARQLRDWGFHYLVHPAPLSHFSEENALTASNIFSRINDEFQRQRFMLMLSEVEFYFPRMRDSLKRDSLTHILQLSARGGLPGFILNENELAKVHPDSYKSNLIRRSAQQNLSFEGLNLAPYRSADPGSWVESFIKSGADMVIARPEEIPDIREALLQALESDQWSYQGLDQRLMRLLLAKSWASGLLPEDDSISLASAPAFNRQLEVATLTLIKDNDGLLPLRDLKNAAVHLVSIGEKLPELLTKMRFYGPVSQSHISPDEDGQLPEINLRNYRRYDPTIFAINLGRFDSAQQRDFLRSLVELDEREKVLILNMGPIENLKAFSTFNNLIQAYENRPFVQDIIAQGLFGALPLSAWLPFTLNEDLPQGLGKKLEKSRLGFAFPEEVGVDPLRLARIDTIVYEGLSNLAMPGCQVLVVRKGEIIYNKAFGYQTYARRRRVLHTDLYDIASITKVAGTTLATMKMMNQRKIRLGDRLGRFFRNHKVIMDSIAFIDTSLYVYPKAIRDSGEIEVEDTSMALARPIIPIAYIPEPDVIVDTLRLNADSALIIKTTIGGRSEQRSRIFDIQVKDLLTHHSGLPAGLPIRDFLSYWRKGYGRYGKYFSPQQNGSYDVEVAYRLYLRHDYLDSLWERTKAMEIDPLQRYNYSDANFVLLQQAIDSINKIPLDSFLEENIYAPMGLQHLTYRPRNSIQRMRLVPTERDAWRNQLLRGHVHDPTAALLGGISGNAGLFSNAGDLAHLFQMILQGGTYGEERYINSQTIHLFTRVQEGDRGFGFDMVGRGGNAFAAYQAPYGTYGHTGFTGTCVWVDPKNELIYIFLSNRNHPRSSNWTLNELRIRQRIHEAIYMAIKKEG